MKKYIFIISIFFISCQKEITLDISSGENKLVVEGAIENGYPPYVILTKNQGYFDPVNSETYTNLFEMSVDSIKVWYIDENGSKINKPLELLDPQISETFIGEAIPLYTVNENELTEAIIKPGEYNFSKAGRTYFLEIKWNGQTITSTTTIPNPTPLDCLWVKQTEEFEDKDFKCEIRAIYSDPADVQNNILIRSKRTQHYTIKDSVECEIESNPDRSLKLVDAGADVLINGETFETYFPRPGDGGFPTGKYNSSRYKNCNNGNDSIRIPNDVVLIKFCQIDEPSLKFWRSLVRQFGTNGNPFSEPMNLVTNIDNGLGVWTGYGATYYKVPIIKDTVIFNMNQDPNILNIF